MTDVHTRVIRVLQGETTRHLLRCPFLIPDLLDEPVAQGLIVKLIDRVTIFPAAEIGLLGPLCIIFTAEGITFQFPRNRRNRTSEVFGYFSRSHILFAIGLDSCSFN